MPRAWRWRFSCSRHACSGCWISSAVRDLGVGRGRGCGRRARTAAAALTVLSIVRARHVMMVEFPDRPLFEVGVRGDWGQVAAWAQTTPKNSGWLADPVHAARYGTSLRMAAARDVFVEGTKDSAVGMADRSIAIRTRDRLRGGGVRSTPAERAPARDRIRTGLYGHRTGHAAAAGISGRRDPRLSSSVIDVTSERSGASCEERAERSEPVGVQGSPTIQEMPDYVPRWTRGGGHWMTIYCWGRRRRFPRLPAPEERLFQVDNDTRCSPIATGSIDRAQHPLLILLHGLEGSSSAHYMQGLPTRRSRRLQRHPAQPAQLRRHRTACRWLHHSGLTHDADFVLRETAERDGITRDPCGVLAWWKPRAEACRRLRGRRSAAVARRLRGFSRDRAGGVRQIARATPEHGVSVELRAVAQGADAAQGPALSRPLSRRSAAVDQNGA